MTKEEQIEKMAKDIAGIEQQDDLTLGEVYGIEATFELAEILCDAGYRKADEVRKETAREILNLVYQRVKDISGKSEYLLDDESIYEDSSFVNVLNNIGQKYGVEVEE